VRWWLSFADGSRPTGTQFLGAVIVEAPDLALAIGITHMLGINPGGEVMGAPLPGESAIHESWLDVLLSRAEIEAAEAAPGPGGGYVQPRPAVTQ
jgi:hypothetical protein